MSGMASNLQASSTTRREKEADINKQLSTISSDFSKTLVAIIAAKSFFSTNQNVMICLVAMIVVYFLVVLLGTLLQLYITDDLFFTILSCVMLLIGSAVSVLALILIEPIIAFIIAILWTGVFILITIFHRRELCEFMSYATGKVKNLIGSVNLQTPRPEV